MTHPSDPGRSRGKTATAAGLLSLALVAMTTAAQERTFTWYANDAGGYGHSAGIAYSYGEALQAIRGVIFKGLPFWQHAVPSGTDPQLVVMRTLPKDGYGGFVAGLVAPTPDAVCAAAFPQICAGCTYTGNKQPWGAAAGFVDYWACEVKIPQPPYPPYYNLWGYAAPVCLTPGYSWSNNGYHSNFAPYDYPPAVCASGAYGRIIPNGFDPNKCAEDCAGTGTPSVGNPIHAGIGVKTHREEIYRDPSLLGSLTLGLHYSSLDWPTPVKRSGWSHSFARAVAQTSATTVSVYRDSGVIVKFALTGTAYLPDADVNDRLARLVDGSNNTIGWSYFVASREETETYATDGRLLSIKTRSGAMTTLAYSDASTPSSIAPSPGLLVGISDPFGRSLRLTYDSAGRVASTSDPSGQLTALFYDAKDNLTSIARPGNDVRVFHYENAAYPNALTGISDERGNRFATYQYDTHGRATSTQHAGGADTYSLAFQANGSTSLTDPLGTVRTIAFTAPRGALRVASISQPCPHCGMVSSAITYDTNGNIASRTDFRGSKTCYSYDQARNLETARVEGLLASEICTAALVTPPSRPDVRKTTTSWNPNYRLPETMVEPAPGGNKTTTFTYDSTGNLIKKQIVAPKNDGSGTNVTRTWSWTYGTFGRVLTATDPNGKVTKYAYHADNDPDSGKRGNLESITNALGHVTRTTAYDANGRPLTTIDPNGLTHTLSYHARGWLKDRSSGGEVTSYVYDGIGQLTGIVLPDSSTLAYAYDAAHRLVQVKDGLGNRIVYTLDAMGNRLREDAYDPAGTLARTRARAFDALNRLSRDIGALGQATTYAYDGNGNRTARTDPLLHVTGSAYDAFNRPIQIQDPAAGVVRYAYDPGGNLSQVTDPRGLATIYTFDGLGNLVRQASPDTGVTAITHDPLGNVVTRTDANGATATYKVDGLSRVTSVAYSKAGSSTETHAFTYDTGTNGKGRLTQVSDPAATTKWTYTVHGRVASKAQVTGAITLTTSYTYNAAGQLAMMKTPSGQQIRYAYLNNRIVSVTVNNKPLLNGIVTTPFGPVGAWQWANGLHTFRDYDADGRLVRWTHRNGTELLRNDIAYDAASRILAISDPLAPALSGAYQYDALDRLAVAQLGTPATHTQQFSYDAAGNRTTITLDGAAASLSYGVASNQLQSMVGVVNAGYLNGAGTTTFAYSNANRLTQVQMDGAIAATYGVNGLGQRVTKDAGGVSTRVVYDEHGRVLGEYTGIGQLIQETVWLDDLPVATLRPTGAGTPTPIAVYYVHADHLGSPRAVTRPSDNAFLWRWDNVEPFGSNAANQNPAGLGLFAYNLRFPGQYFDAETGMHYNYFRDYDPSVGRYIESDPIGLDGGLNTYAYVIDPLGQVDPTGEMGRAPPPGKVAPGPIVRPGSPNAGCGPNGKLLEFFIPDYPIFSFRGCCNEHDDCYADCKKRPTKEACDDKFCDCLRRKCRVRGGAVAGDCLVIANAYCNGVKGTTGQGAFDDSRKDCKNC